MINLMKGDCLELMKSLPSGSVDMILCDLPYGTTQNKWDTVIDLPSLWSAYWRVLKADGAIVLTAQTPFDKMLGASCIRHLKYELIWEKPKATGHLNAKRAPMKAHENVLVFCCGRTPYYPQMGEGVPYSNNHKPGDAGSNYGSTKHSAVTDRTTRYPRSVLKFGVAPRPEHPTQKPVALMEYMIKTYTHEGMTVLDNCMGSGTTGVACVNTGRSFIGMEMNDAYFEIAEKRISEAQKAKNL